MTTNMVRVASRAERLQIAVARRALREDFSFSRWSRCLPRGLRNILVNEWVGACTVTRLRLDEFSAAGAHQLDNGPSDETWIQYGDLNGGVCR